MAKFLETKQTIDNSVKKKKKKQQTQVQPKTQPKKQSQPSQKVQQTTQRFTQKYGGGSSSGGSSRGRSSGTRQRTSQPSQQTLSTNERLRQKYGVGQTRSTSTPTSRYRSQNSRTESRLSQKSQSTVDRLSQKYGTNNAQQREEPEKRYKTKFSAKQQESLNRLDEKYKTGRVTGGKHSFMDNAADYSKNLVKAAGQGLELAGKEDLALANRFSNPSSANKFYNRELNATDYEKNKQRMALRQEGLRQKIKQQQQEMSDLAEGQNSKLGRLGVEAAQSAGGMLADTMAGPFSLVHMGARVTEGAQGDVIDKVEPMKKKMLASGNYTPEEVDEMFKDVEKWDFANAIMQGTIEGLTEKMFGGIGLAKKVGGAGVLDKVAGRIAGSKLTSNVFGKVLAGTAEEIAEEEIGNPAQAFASNLIYGNKLQAANEDMTRRELQSQSDDIRSQVQSEDDARRIAENLSSDDFMEESIKSYMESGSSKKEATHLAELSRDYLTASLEGDTERMKELQDEMVDIIAGGENSMKEKWTLQDALDVGISTAMMTVATGVPGAMTTSAMGTAYKDAHGMDRVRNLAQTALNLNTEESAKAQAIIDSIDNGDELTGTQIYDVMSWAQSAAVEAKEREQVKDDLAEKRMDEEDLMVMPSVVTENGYQLSEATEERFETFAEQTLAKIDELDIDAYKDGGMDAYEIADTVAAYETGTITAEQMNALNIENPENRSVFEEMTGIDLSQYNVTDRNGRINEAASNVAMQTALFAKAADNYVESARIEQENWNNTERGAMAETLSKRIGGQGDKAVYQAMMDVDPRDRSKFELMGRASETVYRFAYNTEGTWDDAEKEFSRRYPSLSNASLKAVFEAAKDDKATANTKYYGEAVKAGEALSKKSMDSAEQVSVAGKFTNDTDVTLKADDQVFLQDMASTFNVNIEAVESMPIRVTDRNGNVVERQANGQFNRDTNTLVINLNADVTMPLRAIVSHELTHSNAYAPDEMLKLLNYIRDSWYRNDPEGYTNAINERKSRYSAEQNLSDLDALEEIVADGAQDFDFWNDSELAERIATEEPTLAAKIINTIKDILRRIRSMLMSDNITNEDYRNALFAHAVDMNEAERLWLEAAKVAQQHRAEQMIDEWDANARQRTVEEPETRHSINDADIMPEEETQNRLEENFDDYKEDKDNLRLATEAITDLQNVRYSVAENISDISGRWSRGEQVRTIGKGITADLVNEGYVEFRGRKVKGPEDLAKLCQVLRDPRFETFRVVLTKGDKIVSLRSISSRLPGLAQAFESENISDGVDIVRDRMKRTGADGYYLIHNHPSGNVTASFADLSVTRAYLALLGQDTYKGHIILDHDKYGFIDADVPQVIRGENFPTAREESITGQQTFDLIHEPEIDHPLLGEEIHGHADIAKCGQFVNASDDVSVLLYTNSPGEVTGIQEISNKTLKNNKEITGFIRNQGVEFGAASAFLYTTDIETYQASKDLVKSGHLVDSVVAYGNNRQWSESAREVVSPRADVEVLGQVHDDVIRRTHVFESATGVTEYRYSLPETDNEGKALTQDQREFFRDVAPELLDDNGNIKRYFHGTARADRVGYYFNPERATSGPMAYFTDNRDIAANYSRDKADTSLAYEGEDVNDYHNQFVVDVDGEEVRLEDYWYQLPANKRIEYRERAGHITYDYDGEDDTALIIDENVNNGNGGYGADPYLNRQARGNVFKMLIDAWLDSGDFFNEEERFLEVMDLLGVEGVRYKDPNYREEKVYEVYLNVTNPLVTTDLDEEFAADVEDWLDNTDLDYYARESASADMWDKNDRDPYDWLEALRDDIENGTTHVWTSIPDVITDFLREQGYDGIVDQGGKYHEAGHQVVIPFEPNQIKLTTNEHPTEDVDIRYSIAETDSEGNFLSDGQRRYFNNSLAVDEQGRLVPVYHTTNNGGFTVFDPSYSDDHRSLFFSNSFAVSQTYGHRASRPIDLGKAYFSSWSDFERYAQEEFANDPEWDSEKSVTENLYAFAVPTNGGADISFEDWMKNGDEIEAANPYASYEYHGTVQIPTPDAGWVQLEAGTPYDLLGKISRTLGRKDSQKGYYTCYLNLENPLIIDAHGQYWNDIHYGNDAETEALTIYKFDEFYATFGNYNKEGKPTRLYFQIEGEKKNNDHYEPYEVLKQFDLPETLSETDLMFNDERGILIDQLNDYWQNDMGFSQLSLKDLWDEEMDFSGELRIKKGYPLRFDLIGERIYEEDTSYTTRQLAALAEDEGYDGVIIRNLVDVGGASGLKGNNNVSDIFIAFNASQVKDTRNENPTDDPDIRYSFPPETEDEINSRKDYDHASSDDFEILNAYEQMIEDGAAQAEFMNLSDEYLNTAYFMEMMERYGKADKRARKTGKTMKVRSVLANYETEAEKMDAFYRSLMEETSMVYDDEYMEEGRRRMAKSKEDFYSNLNAKWNDRWLSGGEVLNVDSVKGNVRELVKATMANSSADAQYRIDTVNKTLFDMRTAYMFMKQGRQDIASAILYQSAQRMIGDLEFVADDTEYKNYKELRAYLRDTKIEFTDDYWEDIDWNAYRKKNFGRLKLIKGNKNSIDDGTYDELVRQWPEYFSDAEMEKNGYKHDVPGMMQQLDYVLDLNVQPVMEAYSSESAADLAFSIADDLYTIMENGDRVTSLADRYKEKYDAKTKALKVRHAEALLRMREMRDKGIAEANRRFREYKAQQKESKYHSKYFDSITKSYDKLTERLLTNTKDKHIPEMYKKDLAQLLSAFDLQTVGSKKFEARTGRRSQKTIKMDAIKTVLTNIGARDQLFHVNDSITDIIDRLLGKDAYGEIRPANSIEGKTIDELPAEALKDIDQLLKALIHEFNTYESVRVGAKRQQAADIGTTQIGWCLDHADKFGKGKDYQNVLGGLDKLINLDEVTPAYMFRMIDPNNEGIGLMYKELRRSFGKYVNNQKQLNEWMNEIIGEYHNKGKILGKYGANQIEKWRRANSAIEFEFGTPENPQKVELTPAQMMSIYCLAKRQQALQHMQQGGIVVMPVSFQARMVSDIKKNANYSLPVKLTDANIKTIVSRLTPEQKSVADKLQNLMATKMADWGNEASMNVIGIKLFEDPNYFPIKSDKAAMEKDFTEEQFAQMIRNFGFTKAVMPNANNSIAINDIFDVVAEHCNNMNLYNAYSETMNDFMKVYNYKEYHDDGSHYTVEQAIAHAYSRKATTFISSFMKDLNGNVSKGRVTGIDAMMNAALGNAKKASVFANGRVALQQPTALARAFYVIKPKYLKGVKYSKDLMQEMFDHSPIALWKSWGYYDINMGKSIEDLMMNEGSVVEDWMSDIYGKLDNLTWAHIWGMCKNETKDLHPEVEEGSDEFWEIVSERMDEVVDLTQVVDSPFHRSHAMRDKQILIKMATSFMAEPTLTFNMVRDGILRAKEQLMAGNKREAAHTMSHTLTVFALSAFATSAFAAIWDVVRGKGLPEDDDDKDKDLLSKMQGFYQAWVTNTMENFGDNANILGNIYYVKDIVSLFQGWDQKNLGLQGMKHLADAFRQMKGEDVHSKLTWYENALAGIGYLSGKPLKTIMNDGKTLFKMFGFDIPEPIQASIDWLDRIGKDAKSDTVKDINKGETSTTGVSSNAPADKPVETRLWTYDNAPFHVEDGSLADTFLNHFGINLTKSEIAAAEAAAEKAKREEEIQQITKGLEKYSGEDYDKHLWDKKALEGYSKALEDGDFAKAKEIEDLFLECGGSQSFIDEKKLYHYKKNYLKTITYDPSDVEIENQQRMKEFLLSHGMTESELSEKVYKSQTAKELKVAFLLNDEDAMVEELIPLVRAGLSEADYEKLWKNRKRVDLVKYKESGGKYAERLKSTGKYIWPVSGRIASESEINSYFGHRSSPGGVGSTNHQGIDLDGSMGDPVGAADGGTVVFAGWYGGAGKTVKIQHDDGTITQYSHLSWWGVKEGDVVGQGQTIGNVGSTGNSTGPHLHFGVIKNDSYVDPYEYLFS